jgi:glycosyltransferase involved in cell wall biosynthesis
MIGTSASGTMSSPAAPLVAILLSTYDGAKFLPAQLESFLSQTHTNWTLHWRDDGSSDDSVQVVRAFAEGAASGRCVCWPSGARLNATGSFLSLLRRARATPARFFAFSDQDDVWLPAKLSRGVAALPEATPTLYCCGHILVDGELRPIGQSAPLRRQPGFLPALTQNIAQGCTIIVNRAAADLILAIEPPPDTVHDWWCYLVVTAAGGQVVADPTPSLLYRQHDANQIGVAATWWRRGIAAMRRGRRPFINLLRRHIRALQARPGLLADSARDQLTIIARAMDGGILARLAALRLTGFVRQTWQETLIFRLWFLLGDHAVGRVDKSVLGPSDAAR